MPNILMHEYVNVMKIRTVLEEQNLQVQISLVSRNFYVESYNRKFIILCPSENKNQIPFKELSKSVSPPMV